MIIRHCLGVIKDATTVVLSRSFALRASDDAADSLPTRFKILNWGKNVGRTTGAEIYVSDKTVEILSSNQELLAHDTVPLDYEHQSVEGHGAYKEPPHHYAAHGRIEAIKGEGVFFTAAEYTPNGQEYAASYKDVSAVAYADDEGNVIFIRSVALTQNGDVEGMEFMEALSAQLDNSPTKPINKSMDNENDKHKAMLIELLGLKPADGEDNVTDEAIASAVSDFTETMKNKPDQDKTPDHDNVVALTARIDNMEKQRLVDNACIEGKVIPLSAEEILATPTAILTSIIGKLPAGEVNLDKTAQGEKPTDKVALSADEKALCERLGVSEEDFKSVNT